MQLLLRALETELGAVGGDGGGGEFGEGVGVDGEGERGGLGEGGEKRGVEHWSEVGELRRTG